MKNSIGGWVRRFDSTFSVLEKVFTIVAVVSGATVTVWLSKAEPYLSKLGVLGYLLIFTFSVSLYFIIRLLYSASVAKKAQADFFSKLNVTSDNINPLSEHYEGKIIKLEDLRLPLNKPQSNKTFRKCTLMGPMTILLGGVGGVSNSGFISCDEVIVLPKDITSASLSGVLKFISCSFHECEFIQTTLIIDHKTAERFKTDMPGVNFIGL